jgi:hypothetical protein
MSHLPSLRDSRRRETLPGSPTGTGSLPESAPHASTRPPASRSATPCGRVKTERAGLRAHGMAGQRAHGVASVPSAFGAANDNHVHARLLGHLQIGECAHLGRGEDCGITKAGHRTGNVAETDRHQIRSEIEHRLDLLGCPWLRPRHQANAVGRPTGAGNLSLSSDPVTRRGAANTEHAQAACLRDSMSEATLTGSGHRSKDEGNGSSQVVGKPVRHRMRLVRARGRIAMCTRTRRMLTRRPGLDAPASTVVARGWSQQRIEPCAITTGVAARIAQSRCPTSSARGNGERRLPVLLSISQMRLQIPSG